MLKEMVCINCPMSCHLSVTLEDGKVVSVSGNTCPRGVAYAEKELTNPTRMLTSTVLIQGGIHSCLPVISSGDLPKDKIFDVMKEIQRVEVQAPVKVNDVIIENVCGLGVDIIASRSMGKA